MSRVKSIIILLAFIVTFSSCFQEEEMLTLPPTNGELEIGVAEMTDTYQYQVYYDLATNTTAHKVLNTSWDLGFACADTAWNIVLNNSKMMLAGNSNNKNFGQVTSTGNIQFNLDNSNGNPDSVAINQWVDLSGESPTATNFVYVIDRGIDENFEQIGFKKVVFETQENDTYKIRFANLDGSNEQFATIKKDADKNYICFSFDNGIVDVEPRQTEWTLLFTSYQTVLYTDNGEAVPYLVRGVLLNPYLTAAGIDTLMGFSEINLNDSIDFNISTQRDIIGHDWKYYDFDDGVYSVKTNRNYIIRGQDRYFYKLRFISFYNNINQKGYPTFEFMRL